MISSLLPILLYILVSIIIFYIFYKIIIVLDKLKKYRFSIASNKTIVHREKFSLWSYFNTDSNVSASSLVQIHRLTLPIDLILNGASIDKNLLMIKKDIHWLNKILSKNGINDITNVSHAYLTSSGKVEFLLF
ncbi:YetF domain-containing protein [Sporosalibacterium faouarense]|uniref:YetF domain-containing protein n=1 Tax=Sporosalibacterium faouarense TaxID=516123 RepID=UPI00192B6921|nr:YetF domain-containing protein [Sporosalibacterium faouarense]